VLGAGFGGLELSTRLAEELGDAVHVTLIDRSDAFVFGFSKFDVMFAKKPLDAIRLRYADITTPQVRVLRETITAIDPLARHVTTENGSYTADVLVVALGADYDIAATPGLAAAGNEFYSVPGATRLRDILPTFTSGTAIVGVCGPSFKCPPAPSEAAFLLDEYLRERNVRHHTQIKVVIPFGAPVPPSPETSAAILERFAERGIEFVPNRRVTALESGAAVLDDGTQLPYDLFLGVPVHCVPEVVQKSGMTENGWIPVEPRTLATRFPGVYAVGDVTSVGTPKAGVFAEGAARAVADQLIARVRGESVPPGYDGTGSCYIEFGGSGVARVDVDFFSTPGRPTGSFTAPSPQTTAEKVAFAEIRRSRWFGS
jgi:sulfide:quinone oxidoreductase